PYSLLKLACHVSLRLTSSFSCICLPTLSTIFPYTTLFRSVRGRRGGNPRSQRPRPARPSAARPSAAGPSAAGPGIRLLEPGGDEVLGRRDAEHPLLA